jgi:hypothetical protein
MTFSSFSELVMIPACLADGTYVCAAACAQKFLPAQSLLLNGSWKSLMVGGHDAPRKPDHFRNTIQVRGYPIRPAVRENGSGAGLARADS